MLLPAAALQAHRQSETILMSDSTQASDLTCQQLGLDTLEIPDVIALQEPAEGIPAVISTQRGLHHAAHLLASSQGPVALDTERASGIRYGQRAFLVQLKRSNSGIILIDPEAFADLTPINKALKGAEWVLHAAGQDLPCLQDLGMVPDLLFDTELAARLAGFERVGLSSVVEQLLGYKLAKEHSAVDWSKRPLPLDWLNYAALDVEILLDLRDALEEVLKKQGKWAFALEEFKHLSQGKTKEKPQDPWRKTKGIHSVKNRRQLTALRNLWYEREKLAQKKDIAPKRLLTDAALIQAARSMPQTVSDVLVIPGFQSKNLRKEAPRWLGAIAAARREKTPVPYTIPAQGPPPIKAWETKRPNSFTLIHRSKEAVTALANHTNIPAENILAPDSLRRLCWDPPQRPSQAEISRILAELGARNWQIKLVTPVLEPIFTEVLAQEQ